MIQIPFLLTLLFPSIQAANPSRAVDTTPGIASLWSEPLETPKAVLVNPFAAEKLTVFPKLKDHTTASSAKGSTSIVIATDLDANGKVLRVRRVMIPICDDSSPLCDPFDFIARTVSRWEFQPAVKAGVKVSTRGVVDLRTKFEFDSINIGRIRFGPVEQDVLPPPVSTPLLDLDSVVAKRLAEGGNAELPPGMSEVESVDKIPIPPGKTFSIPGRATSLAGDLLVHLTTTGTVDRILPLDVRPAALWPFWQKTVATWRFEPGRTATAPIDCWVRVTFLEGKTEVSGDVEKVASIKKNLPVRSNEPAPAK